MYINDVPWKTTVFKFESLEERLISSSIPFMVCKLLLLTIITNYYIIIVVICRERISNFSRGIARGSLREVEVYAVA